jgi:hypothetical protein
VPFGGYLARQLWFNTVARNEQLGNVFDGWYLEANATNPRANRGQHVNLRWCAQNPNRSGRWFFERFEQNVGSRWSHAVGVFDNHDAKAANRRAHDGGRDQLANFGDGNLHLFGGKHSNVGMRASCSQNARLAGAASLICTLQGGCEGECQV